MTNDAPAPYRTGITQDQMNVWWDRYALRNEQGEQIEKSPEQTFDRVAGAIGSGDREIAEFGSVLRDFRFVPGGRILASAGAGNETVAYNCFVIPVSSERHGNDSRESIFETISRMVGIMSRGGGVGINWSTLRPRNSHLARVNGTSSGAIGWMDVASTAVGEVIQGGSRRGAAMFMLWDWHPDILEFTDAKRDSAKITNANISVAISDAFIEAVKNDSDWDLMFPNTADARYDTDWDGDLQAWMLKGGQVQIHSTIKARDLWRKICSGAHDNGEPGIVFLERYQKLSTAGSIEKIICVNPCGEQGLGEYSVCNLGSMNLTKYIRYPGDKVAEREVVNTTFDLQEFDADVRSAVRFLDNVIDKSYYMEDIPQMRESQMNLRRIGLGVMGLADAMAMMEIRYGNAKSVEMTEVVFERMKFAALWASTELAKEKGAAPGWDVGMLWTAPYLQGLSEDLHTHIAQHGLRNLFLLTQAPTGTTSMFAGVNSGIEPFFLLEYDRNDRMGERKVRVKPYQDWLESVRYKDPLGSPLPDYFVTADQLSVEEHIAVQAAAQKYIDSSISKTVNAPNSHTVEDVDKLYMLCYDSGLKGVSYFREGCNRGTVLSRPKDEVETVEFTEIITQSASPYIRPETVTGTTIRKRTKHGHAFVTVNYAEDNGPIEVFVNAGRANSDISEWSEGLGRLISIALRYGVPKDAIAEQLTGVGGYSKMAPSLSTAVAEALKGVGEEPTSTVANLPEVPVLGESPAPFGGFTPEICTQCGSAAFVRAEGCMTCQVCGNSKC